MSDWTCRCSAKNAERDRYCEGCGAENPKAPRALAGAPKVPETHVPATLPTYPAPTPEDDVLIRAEIARARALLGMAAANPSRRDEPERALHPSRLGLAIDPAIRADVARRTAQGPEPVGAVVGRVLKAR